MHETLQIGHRDMRPEYYLKMLGTQHRIRRKKDKRFRIAFTTEQINFMEEQFKKYPYINNGHRKEVALALNIPEKAVKVWFQNRRMKEKKDNIAKEVNIEASKLMRLDIFNKKLNNPNKVSNDQPISSNTSYTNKCNYDNKVTNSAVCDINSEYIAKNFLETSNNYKSNEDCVQRTILEPQCSKSLFNCSKSEEIPNNFVQHFKDKITNHTNFAKPVINKQQDMKKSVDAKRNNNYKSRQERSARELSLNREMIDPKFGQIGEPNEILSDPKYIFVMPDVSSQMQQYYPSGGFLWNSVNVVPAVNPVNIAVKPVSSSSVVHPNNEKKLPAGHGTTNNCCFCNCHVVPKISANLQGQSSCPQYIIPAIQLPNTSVRTF